MKICIATGTRAEYGLLRPLISKVQSETGFTLQLLVTGAHLSPEFGLTYKQIEEDGLHIDAKVEMLLSSDTAVGISKSMGLGMIGFADAFNRLSPDILIILGDRYEMLSLASAAVIFKIPIVHIHGGEITEGAYDDSIRHAITKLSHLHFTSAEEYRNRVIQMGENPENVHNVGALGLDNIKTMDLLSPEKLEEDLGVKFKRNNYLVTFHPETLSKSSVKEQFRTLLAVIDLQEDSFFVFTKANADTDGRIINQLIDEYVKLNCEKAAVFSSLGSLKFLSLMKMTNAIVGNSSSGIIEAPSLYVPAINIGDRQKGRIKADNVVDCACTISDIDQAFKYVNSEEFRKKTGNLKNPYGDGQASSKIIRILRNLNNNKPEAKTFNDIKYEAIYRSHNT